MIGVPCASIIVCNRIHLFIAISIQNFDTNHLLKISIVHTIDEPRAIRMLKQARCTAARCELRFRANGPQEHPLHSLRRWGRRTRKFACARACVYTASVHHDDVQEPRLTRARRLTLRAADWVAIEGREPVQSFTPCTSYAAANLYHLPTKW